MPFRQLTCHLVFSTYQRKRTIPSEHDKELYAYLGGTVQNLGGFVRAINGYSDHVHLLVDLPPTVSIADMVKTLKLSSSKWLHSNPHFPLWEGWGGGYAIFSVSPSNIPGVLNYVNNQKEHHSKGTFGQEMKKLFDEMGIPYDEKWFQ